MTRKRVAQRVLSCILACYICASSITTASADPNGDGKKPAAHPSEDEYVIGMRKAWKTYVCGSDQQAIREFNRIIASLRAQHNQELLEDLAWAYLLRAEIEESQRKLNDAANDVRLYLKLAPTVRWGNSTVCRILCEESDYDHSAIEANQYIFSTSNHASPYGLLAVCSACLNDCKTSLTNLMQAIKFNFGKNDLSAHESQFCTENSLTIVRRRCEADLRRVPKSEHLNFALAVIDILLGRYDSAIAELNQCLKLKPSMWEALAARANCWLFKGDAKAALPDITKALELNDSDMSNYATLERYYVITGNFDHIFNDLDRRIAKSPRNAKIWLAKGNAYNKVGDIEKALECFSRAIAAAPQSAEAFNARGRVYQGTLQLEKAIAEFSAAIKLQPGDPHPYRDRASCYFALHKYKEMIPDISKVIELTNDPYAYGARAECYAALSRPDLAARDRRVAERNRRPSL